MPNATSLVEYFRFSKEYRQQSGQVDAWCLAANADLKTPNGEVPSWRFDLCTGYGKTLVAYGAFWILKQRGLVDHGIVLVPTDVQREGFVEAVRDANALLGISLVADVITGEGFDYRLIDEKRADIVVGTYQHLCSAPDHFRRLMLGEASIAGRPLRNIRWMLAQDECHHLPADGIWSGHVRALPGVVIRQGLSATYTRNDGKKVWGLPDKPDVTADYRTAYDEQVVKRVIGYIGHYTLHVDVDGKPQTVTTEKLRAEGVTDFEKYEAKRQLRYNRNYLETMLMAPLNDLTDRLARHPNQHQMIVFCMSCQHAHYVTEQINSICKQLDMPFTAEWVGVGQGMEDDKGSRLVKSEAENRRLIKDFKDNRFHILVQVAKADEGFDVKRVSVLVFLHLINAEGKVLQQVGRGLRRNSGIRIFVEDTLSVYGSADTELASLVTAMAVTANEVDEKKAPPGGPDGGNAPRPGGEPGWRSIPTLILVESSHERTATVEPDGIPSLSAHALEFCRKFNVPPCEYVRHFGIDNATRGQPARQQDLFSQPPPAPPPPPPSAQRDLLRKEIKKATNTLTGNIVQAWQVSGRLPVTDLPGAVAIAINTKWVAMAGRGHAEMSPEELRTKYDWLRKTNDEVIRTRRVPSWITL